MSNIQTVVTAMASAGCSADQIAAVVQAWGKGDEDRRSKKREQGKIRQRAYRERNASNALQGVTTRDTPSPLVPPDKEAPTPQEITPPITPQPRFARPRETGNPIIVLQSAIDAASAQRWVQHCGEKRKPISVAQAEEQAAVLNEIRKLGASPAEAIRFAIGKGWTSLGVDYFRNNGFAFKAEQAAEIAEDWQNRMKVWDSDRTWSSSWGPKPGERGCRVPHPLNPKAA